LLINEDYQETHLTNDEAIVIFIIIQLVVGKFRRQASRLVRDNSGKSSTDLSDCEIPGIKIAEIFAVIFWHRAKIHCRHKQVYYN
jgi:hypothetical protein